MFFNFLHSIFSNDMGIDLGTANTLVYVEGEGVVLSEPSVVAVHASTGKVIAVGQDAKRMMGRTPGEIVAIRPMKDGVIADFETVEKMIRYFIAKVHRRKSLIRPRVVIGIPSGITEVERRAVQESALQAGARDIFLIDEAHAAALGANIPVEEPAGNMVIDIGGGTTEIAVMSLGGTVLSDSIRIGGDEFDEAILKFMRTQHNLIIGERTAEEIKLAIGSAYLNKSQSSEKFELKGRDAISGLPHTITIRSEEIYTALQEPVQAILEVTKNVLERTPPELSADIVERGVVLTGGGCLLQGLDKFLATEIGVPVIRAENPLNCVVLGTGKYLEQLKQITKLGGVL